MPVTARTAARHEAVYLRLQALLKQTQAIAAKRPEALLPEATRILAEGLLFDARPFLSGARRRRDWPAVSADQAGLAVQLGQVQAGLEAFEIAHTSWNTKLGCLLWLASDARDLPVRRLRPKLALNEAETTKMQQLRHLLARRIDARAEGHYDRGYRDGALQARAAHAAGAEGDADAPQTYPRLRQLD